MKKIVLLGSTGSIGENTLRVVEKLSSQLQVVGLAVHSNYKHALQQAERFNVKHLAVADPDIAKQCLKESPPDINIYTGEEGVIELAGMNDVDIVLCAVVGIAGLRPVIAALQKGTNVALATKEVLVAAGQIISDTCKEYGAKLLPIDSEHSAIFQCLQGNNTNLNNKCPKTLSMSGTSSSSVNKILLTASGGPFSVKPNIDLNKVTIDEVLDHPMWNMGRKVTVDSATLMNKGLEIMEAHWLFDVPIKNINVIVHPESIVHSMVEFIDGGIIAQLSLPDMRFAIQYALTYPNRMDGELPTLDITEIGELHFLEPDMNRFPCLSLAIEAACIGGTMPAVLNAANEMAVQNFLAGNIPFIGIGNIVEFVMKKHDIVTDPNLDDIIVADKWARKKAVDKN